MITSQQIIDFYYLDYLKNFSKINSNNFFRLVSPIVKNYLQSLRFILSEQIKKYVKVGRIDADFNTNTGYNDLSFAELEKMVKRTFRSDMKRRNESWNKFAEYLTTLDEIQNNSNKLTEIFFIVDRLNNIIHNSGKILVSKLENGNELLKILAFVHTAKPHDLYVKASSEIQELYRDFDREQRKYSQFGDLEVEPPNMHRSLHISDLLQPV
jgi:hypothetical protein